mmetsp:Transcript_49778/g.133260  ORF Transcript_49778/g.133260 Transcript_49778/m.133260 type:complete len:213 (+) Transcript_49778:318-956(+)
MCTPLISETSLQPPRMKSMPRPTSFCPPKTSVSVSGDHSSNGSNHVFAGVLPVEEFVIAWHHRPSSMIVNLCSELDMSMDDKDDAMLPISMLRYSNQLSSSTQYQWPVYLTSDSTCSCPECISIALSHTPTEAASPCSPCCCSAGSSTTAMSETLCCIRSGQRITMTMRTSLISLGKSYSARARAFTKYGSGMPLALRSSRMSVSTSSGSMP